MENTTRAEDATIQDAEYILENLVSIMERLDDELSTALQKIEVLESKIEELEGDE